MEYIFIIYSCKQNLKIKAIPLFHMLNNKLPNCKIYISYGQEDLDTDYVIVDDTFLVLKCNDDYESLSKKTIALWDMVEKIFPNGKGVFKCDDDILPNISDLKQVLRIISENNVEYLGKVNNITMNFYDSYYINVMKNEKYRIPLLVHKCEYASGPLYYLSMNSISVFNKLPILKDILQDPIDYMFEDNMVGYLLNEKNIFPIHYNIYYDHISFYKYGSIQNIKNKFRNIYVYLQGDIGNQLFQVAAGFEMSNKYYMHMILVYKNPQDNDVLSTILCPFNSIYLDNVDFSNVIQYNETKPFDYDPNIIQYYNDYCIIGDFQNKKYINEYKTDFLNLLHNENICSNIKTKYPLVSSSYFIYIGKKDDLLHTFDMDSYLKSAIIYILKKEKQNAHFYIVSNDIKTYSILDGIQKTFINNMGTLESLYFMSLCKKGGICSNSTFSGWATMLNDNPEKTVIFPKQWIHVDYPYEIPFDYTECF